ncbi:hypothetical protein GSI_14190 [Ganoderma sinense ZZ0214-1]|uniref:Uncharacterized protein n=1 Tax=Ganoderma sinense ZZ0214-1 TaxID=1077348 RepID=A0A2G8RSE4_9APHY|nr:hypothetical protein GSI_14190 [Ganoderma sinense ZZ0214-1]
MVNTTEGRERGDEDEDDEDEEWQSLGHGGWEVGEEKRGIQRKAPVALTNSHEAQPPWVARSRDPPSTTFISPTSSPPPSAQCVAVLTRHISPGLISRPPSCVVVLTQRIIPAKSFKDSRHALGNPEALATPTTVSATAVLARHKLTLPHVRKGGAHRRKRKYRRRRGATPPARSRWRAGMCLVELGVYRDAAGSGPRTCADGPDVGFQSDEAQQDHPDVARLREPPVVSVVVSSVAGGNYRSD